MISSIEQFTKLLDVMGIPENEKNELVKTVTPCFEFRDFLKSKYELDNDSIENLIQLKIAAKKEQIYDGIELLDNEDVTYLLISRMSRTISEFAKEENYNNYEGLELALKKVLMMGISNRNTSGITQF